MDRDCVASPVQSCAIAPDVAIPIVYPFQPIGIPYAPVRAAVPEGIDVPESMRRTFTKPNASPPVAITRTTTSGVHVSGLGHAGIAMINGATGACEYWEYGRYDTADFGLVRSVASIAAVRIAFKPSGNPTDASLETLLHALRRTNVGPYAFEAVYIKLTRGAFAVMARFARNRQTAVANKTAKAYDVANNHCFTFAQDVAGSAGIRRAQGAPPLEVELVGGNWMTRGVTGMMAPSFEVPARQMRALQQSYRAVNVAEDGSYRGFTFPVGMNSRT
jgi:hypothetical protein